VARPTDEQIKLVRDAFLEGYIRRAPKARPAPGTSLYAVLESCASVITCIMAGVNAVNPQAISAVEDSIFDWLEADRQSTISPPVDKSAYEPLIARRVESVDGEQVEVELGLPAARKDMTEAEMWPCKRNAEGSF